MLRVLVGCYNLSGGRDLAECRGRVEYAGLTED